MGPTPRTLVLAFAFGSIALRSAGASGDFSFHHENVMGTSLELRVRAASSEAAGRAEAVVLRKIDRLSSIFSGYDPCSEFRRWQETQGSPVVVSRELFVVLSKADDYRRLTAGAFEPRVQALTDLWARSARADRLPSDEEIDRARSAFAGNPWTLDPKTSSAIRETRSPMSLNAIAKGYIVEVAVEAAMSEVTGVRGVLLNVGGDMTVRGELPRRVGIADPRSDSETSVPIARLAIKDRSIATSGRTHRGFRIRGRWYSHIFDPRTGKPADNTISATVIARGGAEADALATAFCVLSIDESLRIARSLPEVECLLVSDEGRIARSPGWANFEQPAAQEAKKTEQPKRGAAKDEATSPAWPDGMEVVVAFEINKPEKAGARYRRPYVAIWVEDKDGKAVRTLMLWVSQGGSGPRWIPDLKRWYKVDQDRQKADEASLVEAVGRPTRLPGKYDVTWDGKDDAGKLLPAGEYTIHIEAAREHGTYQDIRQAVTITDKPFVEEPKGNVEIKSASITSRRRAEKK